MTIIPNNKIRFKGISEQTAGNAARVAKDLGGLARPAYELIEYSKEVENSIKYVFSNFMICSSPEIAQKIAYNPTRYLSCKCVTYDGDIYEQGTLSGGYINNSNFILPRYAELHEI